MDAKASAAQAALKFVRPGMTVGLGTGSTASIFIRLLAAKNKQKDMHLTCVATSKSSEELAKKLGLKVVGLDAVRKIDVAVDGADLVDARLNLVKGGGGAHCREKVVDYAAKRFVVVVDESKLCSKLSGGVPLEILPFAFPLVKPQLQHRFGCKTVVRMKAGRPVLSDNGNFLADARFRKIPDAASLELQLDSVPGIVANGLFTKNVSCVVVGSGGGARTLERRME